MFGPGSVGYKDGVYFIISNPHGLPEYGGSNQFFNDTIIEVDATSVSGPANNHTSYGLGCRNQGFGGYLGFIGGDGCFALAKYNSGEPYNFFAEWQESEAINSGNATNHLRLICAADYLALYVNGQLLAETWDSDFMRGEVILMVASYETEMTEAHFDNLVITQPDLEAIPTVSPRAAPEEGKGVDEQIPDWVLEEQANELLVEAMGKHQMGDYKGEISSAETALEIFQQTGNQHNETSAFQLLGNASLALSDYQAGLEYFNQALAVSQSLGDQWLEARMLQGIGRTYSEISDYEQTLYFYERSLAIDREIHEQEGAAITLGNIGNVYNAFSDYEQALNYFQQSLLIENPSGILIRKADMLGSIGNVYSN